MSYNTKGDAGSIDDYFEKNFHSIFSDETDGIGLYNKCKTAYKKLIETSEWLKVNPVVDICGCNGTSYTVFSELARQLNERLETYKHAKLGDFDKYRQERQVGQWVFSGKDAPQKLRGDLEVLLTKIERFQGRFTNIIEVSAIQKSSAPVAA